MKTQNLLFERLSLQGKIRDLIDRLGRDQAFDIIQQAIAKELDREPNQNTRHRSHFDPHA